MKLSAVLMKLHLNWLRLVWISASLGHRWVDRLRLGTFQARIVLSGRLPLPLPRSVTAQLADGHEVVIATPGELSALREIMAGRVYEAHGTPRVIFDLGANVGFATLFFWRRYPDAQIIAVEADPLTYRRLVRNVGHLPRVTTMHRAVAGSDGPTRFFPSVESIRSSLITMPGSGPAVDVTGASIESLMREAGVDHIDFLKVDIEGAEIDALRAAPLDRVEELITEFHYDLAGGDEQCVRELLAGFHVAFQPLTHRRHQMVHAHRIRSR
jgi:31-O-methyltransferase